MARETRLFLLAVIWLLVACTPGEPTPDPYLEAKMAAYAATVTARASSSGDAGNAVKTAQAQATQFSQDVNATQGAQGVVDQAANQVTATAQAPILAELPLYGADPAAGHVAWIHPPVTLEVDQYRSGDYANEYSLVTARDFVLAADITWDTEYGTSGCGFAVRSDGETEASNQYLIILSRNANGHAYYAALADGKPANYRDFYANLPDPNFKWENGSTNRLTVAGVGEKLWVYTNYTLVGEIDTTQPPPPAPDLPEPPVKPERPDAELLENLPKQAQAAYQADMEKYQKALDEYNQMVDKIQKDHAAVVKAFRDRDTVYEEGFVGMIAYAYSGYVRCQFDNAWLWLMEK
jgi:hypothetical protein